MDSPQNVLRRSIWDVWRGVDRYISSETDIDKLVYVYNVIRSAIPDDNYRSKEDLCGS